MPRKRVAVLISGRGSNMVALIEAAKEFTFPAEIVLVVSNAPSAQGMQRAAASNIATAVVDHKKFGKDREAFERALQSELEKSSIELICLAGFMRLLTPWFVKQWEGRMLNIHPSLLPKYTGLHTHERALAAGDLTAGVTVHLVTAELDCGPILGQTEVENFHVSAGWGTYGFKAAPIVGQTLADPLRALVLGRFLELADQALDGVFLRAAARDDCRRQRRPDHQRRSLPGQ